MVATTQILKKLQLLQELRGEEEIEDEMMEGTFPNLLHSTHSSGKIQSTEGEESLS
jgi:hypothetical protein